MKHRYQPYLILGTLALLAILAFWRRGTEQRARRVLARETVERRVVPPTVSEPTVERARPRLPGPRAVAPHATAAERKEEGPEGLPSWEGKQLSEYTWEERQEVGLTNEKLFANAGAGHWLVLSLNLEKLVDKAFFDEMQELATAYREASVAFAPDDPEENLQKERELLGRLEKTVKLDAMNEEGRRSYEYLKKHVEMWSNGEADKLVDRKIERENDGAKRIALRARQEQDEGKDFDNNAEDGNK
jgi:hypothetical protein